MSDDATVEAGSDLRARAERFSLLRGAQRALARCMHPAVLDPLREQGRTLLIRLQTAERDESPVHRDVVFGEIDALLDHHLGQTLELLGKLEFGQLRAVGPELCRDKPEELRALLDVMLLGGLTEDSEIRLIEYLVTMLCVEDDAGRRAQVADPSGLTPGLTEVGGRKQADPSIDVGTAVARLEGATRDMVREGDHLELRDEIRGFKRGLGSRLLHPEILSATIAYNVAMANQVSARLDSTLALDELAEDLLADLQRPAAGDSDLLHGGGMTRLADALRARIRGAASDDGTASRIVARFKLDGLVAREVEALESSDEEVLDQLIVSAVVLGCVLRQGHAIAERLQEIGLDSEVLERDALPALLHEIGAAASKFFGESRYDEAFLLSAVKTRNLTAVRAALEQRNRRAGAEPSRPSRAGTRDGLSTGGAVRRVGHIVGPILGLLLGWALFGPGDSDVRIVPPDELSQISPFLQSGNQHRLENGQLRFSGQLSPAWDYLATPEREAAASEVASRFREYGVSDGLLRGVGSRTMLHWDDGEIIKLVPKAED